MFNYFTRKRILIDIWEMLSDIRIDLHFLKLKTGVIMSEQTAAAQVLIDLKAQLLKAKGEITAKIQTLIDAAANAGQLDPALAAAVEDLKPVAQQLDDIVPDPVVEPPVEEAAQ